MNKLFLIIQTGLAGIIFCGLNFLFAGDLHAQKISSLLKTIPDHAIVYDMEKNELGFTPFDLSKLPAGVNEIKITLEGYEPTMVSFSAKEKTKTFPASVNSCYNCYLTNENAAVNPEILKLRKKIKERDKEIMVAVDTPVIAIRPETELGKINSNRILMSDRDIHQVLGYPENMQLKLINSFKDSYLDAHFVSYKSKNDANLYKPKIIFKPVVNKLDFTFKGKIIRDYTGPCNIDCTWLVSDLTNPGKVLGKFNVSTTVYRLPGNYDLVLHQMLSESERDLLDNDTLFDFLDRLEKEYLARSKPEALKIHVSSPVTFNATKEMLKAISSSVVTIENESGFGSGSVISPDGYILTSYHVIADEKEISIKLGNSKKVKAEIIRVNKDYDLALLKINETSLTHLSFGNSDMVDVGDEVFAAGTPLEKSLSQSVTRGIISGFREWNGVKFLQTDVSINAGNSGGPMLNSKGEIVGITTMKLIGKGVEGIGFGIPSNLAIEMLNLKLEP